MQKLYRKLYVYHTIARRAFFPCLSFLCIILLASCGQPIQSATSASSALTASTSVPGKPVALQAIHMFTTDTGWAVVDTTRRVLHTSQGAARWWDVTPKLNGQTLVSSFSYFFDASSAWIVTGTINTFFIYRTSDGGANWQKAPLPDQGTGVGQMAFLNRQVGWLVMGKGAAMSHVAVDVLHTTDGGATWKLLASSGHEMVNKAGMIPFEGDKSGISFINANTGWLTGFTPRDNFAWLYVTHDGGATWQHQTIPLPEGATQISTFPPVFFNASDGLLPVELPSLKGETFNIYVTHNAGASWSTTTPLPVNALAETIDFVDAAHGWVVGNTYGTSNDAYKSSTFYRTTDGGLHWTHYTMRLGTEITMLDFVSQTRGWALDSVHTLYTTADGGQTWAKVAPTVI